MQAALAPVHSALRIRIYIHWNKPALDSSNESLRTIVKGQARRKEPTGSFHMYTGSPGSLRPYSEHTEFDIVPITSAGKSL